MEPLTCIGHAAEVIPFRHSPCPFRIAQELIHDFTTETVWPGVFAGPEGCRHD